MPSRETRMLEAQGGGADSAVEAAIRAVLRAEAEAFWGRDFEAFAEHWAHRPDVVRMISGPFTGTRIFRGWDTLAPRVREGMRRFSKSADWNDMFRWENVTINAVQDMAWVSYDQIARQPPTELQTASFQHELKVLERIEGAWKLVCLSIIVPDIERTDIPRVELNEEGRIIWMNALAGERLKDHPGLVVSGNRLRARNRPFDRDLQACIHRVCGRLGYTNSPQVLSGRSADNVLLGEDDDGRVVYCWLQVEQERVQVTFDDRHKTERCLDQAAEIFALSPTQRQMVGLIAEGHDIASIAALSKVSVNTVRTQLRRMYDKAGVRSQSALVSAMLCVQPPR